LLSAINVAHDRVEAMLMADRIALMDKGTHLFDKKTGRTLV
jgi:ABC-type sugar transport system ATPase subunit